MHGYNADLKPFLPCFGDVDLSNDVAVQEILNKEWKKQKSWSRSFANQYRNAAVFRSPHCSVEEMIDFYVNDLKKLGFQMEGKQNINVLERAFGFVEYLISEQFFRSNKTQLNDEQTKLWINSLLQYKYLIHELLYTKMKRFLPDKYETKRAYMHDLGVSFEYPAHWQYKSYCFADDSSLSLIRFGLPNYGASLHAPLIAVIQIGRFCVTNLLVYLQSYIRSRLQTTTTTDMKILNEYYTEIECESGIKLPLLFLEILHHNSWHCYYAATFSNSRVYVFIQEEHLFVSRVPVKTVFSSKFLLEFAKSIKPIPAVQTEHKLSFVGAHGFALDLPNTILSFRLSRYQQLTTDCLLALYSGQERTDPSGSLIQMSIVVMQQEQFEQSMFNDFVEYTDIRLPNLDVQARFSVTVCSELKYQKLHFAAAAEVYNSALAHFTYERQEYLVLVQCAVNTLLPKSFDKLARECMESVRFVYATPYDSIMHKRQYQDSFMYANSRYNIALDELESEHLYIGMPDSVPEDDIVNILNVIYPNEIGVRIFERLFVNQKKDSIESYCNSVMDAVKQSLRKGEVIEYSQVSPIQLITTAQPITGHQVLYYVNTGTKKKYVKLWFLPSVDDIHKTSGFDKFLCVKAFNNQVQTQMKLEQFDKSSFTIMNRFYMTCMKFFAF